MQMAHPRRNLLESAWIVRKHSCIERERQEISEAPELTLGVVRQGFVVEFVIPASSQQARRIQPPTHLTRPEEGRRGRMSMESSEGNRRQGNVSRVADHMDEPSLWEEPCEKRDIVHVLGRLVAPSSLSL
jgi:hypothetical protein